MCTYAFLQVVCPCAKGSSCAQGSRGMARVDGNLHHFQDVYWAVEDLGAACDYQRRVLGRNATATMRCPRYAFDPKRVIAGSYRMAELACIKCVETCAPPSMKQQAPGPNGPFESVEAEEVVGGRAREAVQGGLIGGGGGGAGGAVCGRGQRGFAAGHAAGH